MTLYSLEEIYRCFGGMYSLQFSSSYSRCHAAIGRTETNGEKALAASGCSCPAQPKAPPFLPVTVMASSSVPATAVTSPAHHRLHTARSQLHPFPTAHPHNQFPLTAITAYSSPLNLLSIWTFSKRCLHPYSINYPVSPFIYIPSPS